MARRQWIDEGTGEAFGGEAAGETSPVLLRELWRELPAGRVTSAALAASTADVVVAESGGRVTGYDLLGVRRWEFDCGGGEPRVATTAEAKRTAVVAAGNLWWLDARGQVLWQKSNLTGIEVVAVDPWDHVMRIPTTDAEEDNLKGRVNMFNDDAIHAIRSHRYPD